MKAVIQRLDDWLKNNRSSFYDELLPGANDQEIRQLEQNLGLALPEAFKDLYRWHNGQSGKFSEVFHDNKVFLDLQEIAETWSLLKDLLEGGDFEVENWWRVGWVPFLHDGSGNYLCLDLEGSFDGCNGQLLEFWHDDFDRNILYPNFENYLKTLANCFEQQTWQQDEDYWSIERDCIARHNPGFPKLISLA